MSGRLWTRTVQAPRFWLGAALVAWAGWLFLTHYPFGAGSGGGTGINAPWDKLIHFSGYAVIGLFVGLSLRMADRWLGVYMLAGWLLALGGALDEVSQIWIPFREFNWLDLLCNLFGGWFGIGCSGVPRGFFPLKPIE